MAAQVLDGPTGATSGSFVETGWWNPGSASLSIISALSSAAGSLDYDGSSPYRCAMPARSYNYFPSGSHYSYAVETQGSPTSDSSDPASDILGPGFLGRVLFSARVISGSPQCAIYLDGVQQTTPVSFTGNYWHMIDTGQNYVRDFGQAETLRVWGGTVHLGHLYGIHRPLFLNAKDYTAGSTAAESGSIAGTVATFDISDGASAEPTALDNIYFTGLTVPEQGNVYVVGRVDTPFSTSDQISDDAAAFETGATVLKKNGANVTGTVSISSSRTAPDFGPTVGSNNAPNGWGHCFPIAAADKITIPKNAVSTSTGDTGTWYVDQIVLSRPCAGGLFDSYNDDDSPSFSYSWTTYDTYGIIDHFDLVVTGPGGNDTVISRTTGVTSPHTVVLPPGDYNVYLASVLYDGDFACWDRDTVSIPSAGQIIRYR